MKKIIQNQNVIFWALSLIILIAYFFSTLPFLSTFTTIQYDDPILLDPLKKINSLSSYIETYMNYEIWDIQPIRDLTYLLDLFLIKHISFWNHHIVNFLVWGLIGLFGFYNLSSLQLIFQKHESHQLKDTFKWALYFILLYLIFPAMQIGPFWVANRKHILACLFIMISFHFVLKVFLEDALTKKNVLLISLFYFLSVFSQPITIFYPAFVFIFYFLINYNKNILDFLKRTIWLWISLGLLSVLAAVANYIFYYKFYPIMSQGAVDFIPENIWQYRLLTLGRFFYQSFDFTLAMPVEHDAGSIRNIIGLLSLPLFFWWTLKKLGPKFMIICLAWFMFPISLIIIRNVKLFGLDSYIIVSYFGIVATLTLIFSHFNFKNYYFILLLPVLYFSINYSQLFKDDLKLAKYAYSKEVTMFSQYAIASTYLNRGKSDEAFQEFYALFKIAPLYKELPFVLPLALFDSKKIAPKVKQNLLYEWSKNGFYAHGFYALTYPAGSKRFLDNMERAMQKVEDSYKLPMPRFCMRFFALYLATCTLENIKTCEDRISQVRKNAPKKYWDDELFKENVNEFSKLSFSRTDQKELNVLENVFGAGINYSRNKKGP